jgi:hypothetical protein
MSNKSLHKVIGKLEEMFSTFNNHFFNGELEKPIITISPDTTKGAYGWCTSWKAWKHSLDDKEGYYEINMCAEYLARPFLQTCSTLIHEMVHHKVQDTSASFQKLRNKVHLHQESMCALDAEQSSEQPKKSGSCVLIVNLNLKKKYERRWKRWLNSKTG